MTTHRGHLLIVLVCLAIGALEASAGPATNVAAGHVHTCAVTAAGGVVCWGDNSKFQLGDGTTTSRLTQTPVMGLGSGVAALAAGWLHTCALTTVGSVVCWGDNTYGQLGDGTKTQRPTPTAVSGLESGVAAIVAGQSHTCALTTGGAVVCWGYNSFGQLGDGTPTDRTTPTLSWGNEAVAIVAGGYHTCAVTTDGGVECWGQNWFGQLGDGTTMNSPWPTPVSGLESEIASLAAGWGHTCALTTGGGVVCWGRNDHGQLGDGTKTQHLTPTAVNGLSSGVAAISAGENNTCGRTAAGGIRCWGWNVGGQLGDGTTTDRSEPTLVVGFDSGAAGISAGRLHTCALTRGGGVKCWGWNGYGQLGDGTTTDRWVPTAVDGLGGEVAVSDFTGDLTSDILWRHASRGEVWLWPMNGAARTTESYVRTVADTHWEIRGLGDQDGDARADILWRNKVTGQIYYWPMNGTVPADEIYAGTVDTAYDIVGTGDFDGDGKSDILWRNMALGDVWIWLMDGATPKPGGQVYIDRVDPAYVVNGVGDLDADTKADIVWHGAAGDVWVWLMSGTTRLSQTQVGIVPDTTYQIQQVADFDGNGTADILWWNTERGELWIWPMNGATLLSESYVGTVPNTAYQVVGAGDYDGDARADILWRNVVNGEVWMWLMDGTFRPSATWIGTVPDTGYQIVKAR